MLHTLFPSPNHGIEQILFQKPDGKYIVLAMNEKGAYISMNGEVQDVFQSRLVDGRTIFGFGNAGMDKPYALSFLFNRGTKLASDAKLAMDGQTELLICIDPIDHANSGFPIGGSHLQKLIDATNQMRIDKNQDRNYRPKFTHQ